MPFFFSSDAGSKGQRNSWEVGIREETQSSRGIENWVIFPEQPSAYFILAHDTAVIMKQVMTLKPWTWKRKKKCACVVVGVVDGSSLGWAAFTRGSWWEFSCNALYLLSQCSLLHPPHQHCLGFILNSQEGFLLFHFFIYSLNKYLRSPHYWQSSLTYLLNSWSMGDRVQSLP